MTPRVLYVRWLPGTVEAVTLPPLGIVMLYRKRHDGKLYRHEVGHWKQYKAWGFFKFYYRVLKEYALYGRFAAPVEADATRRGNDV